MGRTKITRAQEATVTKIRDVVCVSGTAVRGEYPDGADNQLFFLFTIPDDYVSGDLTWSAWFRGASTTGSVAVYRGVWRHRIGVAELVIDTYPTSSTVAMGTGDVLYTFTTTAANFQPGDAIRIGINRDGASGGDTTVGMVTLDRFTVSYSGTP